MLDEETRRELRSLSRETADLVSRHLIMTGTLLDQAPEQALAHARAARALAGRIGVVRLAAGLAAYAAGEWNEALSELRAARRITGRPEHLAVFADCERALGRPERALAYGDDPEVPTLSQDERVELVIVLAGARRDLGQADAAVLALQDPARRTTAARPWAVRLWYAYADALLEAGREDEAREWFGRTAGLDSEGETDAVDRVLELDGVVLGDLDTDDEGDAEGGMDDAALTAYVAESFGRPEERRGADGSTPTTAHGEVETGDTGGDRQRPSDDPHRESGDAVSEEAAPEAAGDSAGDPSTGADRGAADRPGRGGTGLDRPFSGSSEAEAPVRSSRPPAALVPTFAAEPDDEASLPTEALATVAGSEHEPTSTQDAEPSGPQARTADDEGEDLTLFT